MSLQQNAEEIEAIKVRRIRLVPKLLWEQRRYEIARELFANFRETNPQRAAKEAVMYADFLVAELEGGQEDE